VILSRGVELTCTVFYNAPVCVLCGDVSDKNASLLGDGRHGNNGCISWLLKQWRGGLLTRLLMLAPPQRAPQRQ